jgi:hypothetical protein
LTCHSFSFAPRHFILFLHLTYPRSWLASSNRLRSCPEVWFLSYSRFATWLSGRSQWRQLIECYVCHKEIVVSKKMMLRNKEPM